MNASELFKAGQLRAALANQLLAVKNDPADHGKRVFLFELLAFSGDLDKARKHIEALGSSETEQEMTVLPYRQCLDAESTRRKLFSDGLSPKFFSPPPETVRLRLEAVNRLREGNAAEAAALLVRAEEQAPPLKGTVNGTPFASLRDWDDVLGHVLEVFSGAGYYWIPFEEISKVTLEAPRFPRDLLWAPAKLTLRGGSQGDVFLPVLYANSHQHADEAVQLGRLSDWQGPEGGPVVGVGQKTFAYDDEAISLLEIRQLELSAS